MLAHEVGTPLIQDAIELGRRERQTAVAPVARGHAAAQLMDQGLEPQSSTPEEFLSYMKREVYKWTKVADRAGATPKR